MKITDAAHKAVLSALFYEEIGINPQTKLPEYKAKQFQFDKQAT